jgi:lysophospholipid acyltransferase (LPLAT)-like uncharacterized protein
MRIRGEFITRIGGLAIAEFIRHWMKTVECRWAYYDPTVDPVHPDFEGPAIFLFWHEYIACPFYLRGHCDIAMLLSQHRDAEWLSQAARHMGFETVRGSTNRGGIRALRELFRKCHGMNLAITPDGPRGPRRELAPGPIYLSSRLGIPLVLTGFGYDRPWRNTRSWDRFALPRPYSRARAIFSPKIQIPPGLDRDRLEVCRVAVQGLLNFLTTEAERWALTNAPLAEQRVVQREGIAWWKQAIKAA